MHTHVFARLARSVALANGMPRMRQAFVPQPVVDRSAADLRGYIEGIDPISKRPFVQEMIEGLTKPLQQDDLKGVSFERSTPRLLEPDTEENLHRLFIENHWTDFLPIMLPTEERVAAMLKGTSHPPDKVVGRLRPTNFREFWEFTVEKVAVNAVMAGARPEYLPVILAHGCRAASPRARAAPRRWPLFPSSTARSATRSAWSSGIGVMGPYNHANATIGRAYSLLSQNLQGGSVPGETYMGSLGNWYSYSARLRRGRGAQPVGAAARAEGLQADRQRRQRLLRRLVHAGRLRSARDLAGEDAPLPVGGGTLQPAVPRAGSRSPRAASSSSASTRRS